MATTMITLTREQIEALGDLVAGDRYKFAKKLRVETTNLHSGLTIAVIAEDGPKGRTTMIGAGGKATELP